MTIELLSDNAATTLTSSPASGATSFTVASSTGFPAAVTGTSQFRVIIGTEIVTVTNVSGTTWTCVATSAAHSSADVVTHVLTASSLGNFVDGKIGGPWTAWAPTFSQSGVRGTTVNYAKYTVAGKNLTGSCVLTATAVGVAANTISINPPIVPVAGMSLSCVGTFIYFAAASVRHAGSILNSSGSFFFLIENTSNVFGATPSYAIAVGDQVMCNFSYEIP
jgi:hypothetical protein